MCCFFLCGKLLIWLQLGPLLNKATKQPQQNRDVLINAFWKCWYKLFFKSSLLSFNYRWCFDLINNLIRDIVLDHTYILIYSSISIQIHFPGMYFLSVCVIQKQSLESCLGTYRESLFNTTSLFQKSSNTFKTLIQHNRCGKNWTKLAEAPPPSSSSTTVRFAL